MFLPVITRVNFRLSEGAQSRSFPVIKSSHSLHHADHAPHSGTSCSSKCRRQRIFLLRLVLAAILGGAIGLEREFKHRPAGLRTNLFICLGAAMFTLALGRAGGQASRRPHAHRGTDYSRHWFHRRWLHSSQSWRPGNRHHFGSHAVRGRFRRDGRGRRPVPHCDFCHWPLFCFVSSCWEMPNRNST